MAIIDIKRQIKIVDYAASLGFHPVRVGRWYSLKEHDSIRIDPEKNLFFRNSTGQSGSIIDFVMAFTGKDLNGAIKELEAFSGSADSVLASVLVHEEERIKRETKIILPKSDKSLKNVYAYLIKTRGIDRRVVDWMVIRKFLYQDLHKNCVFVSRKNGVPIFASVRGTNTYKRFVADVPGSDYNHGLYFPQVDKKDSLYIFESAIDMMSFITLEIETEKDFAASIMAKKDYFVLSGVGKKDAVINAISSGGYKTVFILLDNDNAGKIASEEIEKRIKDINPTVNVYVSFPKKKDWNDELLKRKDL